jgi:hypothetical protein
LSHLICVPDISSFHKSQRKNDEKTDKSDDTDGEDGNNKKLCVVGDGRQTGHARLKKRKRNEEKDEAYATEGHVEI